MEYNMALENFLAFLDTNTLVNLNKISEDSDEGFSNRLKTQKYVYLAKYFGLDFGYNYGMHLHGPYSRGLTGDYYRLGSSASNSTSTLDSTFDSEKFLRVLKDKDENWLEIAATILHKRGTIEEGSLLEYVSWIKCEHTGEFIDSVYSDLKETILQ